MAKNKEELAKKLTDLAEKVKAGEVDNVLLAYFPVKNTVSVTKYGNSVTLLGMIDVVKDDFMEDYHTAQRADKVFRAITGSDIDV